MISNPLKKMAMLAEVSEVWIRLVHPKITCALQTDKKKQEEQRGYEKARIPSILYSMVVDALSTKHEHPFPITGKQKRPKESTTKEAQKKYSRPTHYRRFGHRKRDALRTLRRVLIHKHCESTYLSLLT